jgi:hypothetical protein
MTQAMISFQKIAKDGRVKQPAKQESRLVQDLIDKPGGEKICDETWLGRVLGCMQKVPLR